MTFLAQNLRFLRVLYVISQAKARFLRVLYVISQAKTSFCEFCDF